MKRTSIALILLTLLVSSTTTLAQTRGDLRDQEIRDREQEQNETHRQSTQESRGEEPLEQDRQEIHPIRADAPKDGAARFRQEIEQKREVFRHNLAERQENAREEREQKRQELRERLAQIQDERKRQIVERIASQFHEINERLTNHFLAVLNRLEDILSKIQARADRLAQNNVDTSSVNAAIDKAMGTIETTKAAIREQVGKVYEITIEGEDTLRANVGQTRQLLGNDLKAIHELVRQAYAAVKEALEALKNLPRPETPEGNDNTSI